MSKTRGGSGQQASTKDAASRAIVREKDTYAQKNDEDNHRLSPSRALMRSPDRLPF